MCDCVEDKIDSSSDEGRIFQNGKTQEYLKLKCEESEINKV